MKKKKKCYECKGETFELASSKEPDKIEVVCFSCGIKLSSYHISVENVEGIGFEKSSY